MTSEDGTTTLGDKRVLIVLMPWAAPVFPGLGPALLRSILNRDGISCDILYGNLVFSKMIDGDAFFEQHLGKFAICELAFTPYYFNSPQAKAAEALWRHARDSARDGSLHKLERYEWLVSRAGACLDAVYASVPWDRYDIIGFSVMMQQTVPSLALARMIRRDHPDMRIVFGGPNCSWPMGEEIIRCFPEVDVVVEGEADGVIGPLVRELRSGGRLTPRGVYYRDEGGNVRRTAPGAPFTDVNGLPVPDYGPFFEQMEALGLDHFQPYLQMETSRGCWWGQKHHCSFCSLEDALIKFRSKSEDGVLREILDLASRHRYTEFFPTDSIMNHRFYKTLLPRLAQLREDAGFDFTFFFEVKSNLKRKHARVLRAAGVNAVQPGIESFNDHILELMDKGSSGIRQVQCLKALAECGIVANWNMIFRNPNERAEDYRQLVALIPFLHHLPPLHDEGLTPMLLMRFSPYFERPEKYGIRNVRPAYFYADIFPAPTIDLHKIAFYFDFDHSDHENEELKALHLELVDAIEQWRKCYRENSLEQFRGPGFVNVVDRRAPFPGDLTPAAGAETVITLEGKHAELFSYWDDVRTHEETVRSFAGRIAPNEIDAFVEEMVRRRLVYRSADGALLNLPLLFDVRERSHALPRQLLVVS